MSNSPRISVLMTVYNSASYLEEAIMSILNQTFSDFEFLIFNDGSSDNSREIILSINDSRIRFFDDPQNVGYVKRVNEGLKIARGEYIARMDSDDIALPERFGRQLLFLDNNPEVGLCGSSFEAFGDYSFIEHLPIEDWAIREMMLSNNPIGQSTVMLRKSVIQAYNLKYEHESVPVEDYWMWYQLSKVTKLHNLPDILLKYRRHSTQISVLMNKKQRIKVNEIRVLQLLDKGFTLSNDERDLYCRMLENTFELDSAYSMYSMMNVMNNIIKQNKLIRAYREEVFTSMFSKNFQAVINKLKRFSPLYILPVIFNANPLITSFSIVDRIKFVIKSAIFWQPKGCKQ